MTKTIKLNKNEKADSKAFKTRKCIKDNGKKTHYNSQNLKLLGPISYYYYPDIDGRSILLLGDMHTPTSQCIKCNNNVFSSIISLHKCKTVK